MDLHKSRTLDLQESDWDIVDGDISHLRTRLFINGVGHHLEAFQVIDIDGLQDLVDPSQRQSGLLQEVWAEQGRLATIRMFERDYCVVLTPFGA